MYVSLGVSHILIYLNYKQRGVSMFGNLFKKTEPEYWLVEQPGNTMVLLLPAKFLANTVMNQVFSIEDRKKLHEIFEKREANHLYEEMGGYLVDEPQMIFHSEHLQEGEVFYSQTNDLNSEPGKVREIEFFANR
jgi:hypothetical protein